MALYLFDGAGLLKSAVIENLGPRATMEEHVRETRRDELLASLGRIEFRRIEVAPFSIERFGGFEIDARGFPWRSLYSASQ